MAVGSGERFAELPSGITICHETFGRPTDPAVLLIMGLGGHMTWWRTQFCEALSARGFFVIRLDNRDVGRSSRVTTGPRFRRADLVRAFLAKDVGPPYTLSDMADDCIGLLDHLAIAQVHVVGVSLGGMVAQTLVIEHSERALSLVSMMSSTGRRTQGFQHPRVLASLLTPAGRGKEAYVASALRTARLIRSPGFSFDETAARARAEETYERGFSASGVARQLMAAAAQPDRTAALRQVTVPTTVIHGTRDPLIDRSGGRGTARAIAGADLIEIVGLAHDLPPDLDRTFIDAIARTAAHAY